MRHETWLLAADEDEYLDMIDAPRPLERWSGISVPGFDTLRLATLHGLLTGDTMQASIERYEPIYVSSDDEVLILRVAEEMLESLIALDEESLVSLASELVASEDFDDASWAEDDLFDIIVAIKELAELAESQGQAIFLLIRMIDLVSE